MNLKIGIGQCIKNRIMILSLIFKILKNLDVWGIFMESFVELLIYVNCICKDCGHKWESEMWVKSCPECNNDNICQTAMMRGL